MHSMCISVWEYANPAIETSRNLYLVEVCALTKLKWPILRQCFVRRTKLILVGHAYGSWQGKGTKQPEVVEVVASVFQHKHCREGSGPPSK